MSPEWPQSSGGQFPTLRSRRHRTTIGRVSTSAATVEYSWAKTNGSAVNTVQRVAPATAVTRNPPNWHGGVQLGFDYMMPSRLLVGVAADMTSGGTRTTTVTDASGTSANQTTVFDSETIRGRVGYAFDNVLLYGTAGWAWSSINTSVRS